MKKRKWPIRIKKMHRLKTPSLPSQTAYATMCDRFGTLCNHDDGMTITEENGNVLKCTDTDPDVTCVTCVRVILNVKPLRPAPRKTRYFRSKHLRNGIHPLGLLRR